MQHPADVLHDRIRLPQDINVPESNNLEAASLQPSGTLLVVGQLVEMLAPVQLDDELSVPAAEIGDVMVYGDLAPELESVELSVAKRSPELRLCVGLFDPKTSRACDGIGSLSRWDAPSP